MNLFVYFCFVFYKGLDKLYLWFWFLLVVDVFDIMIVEDFIVVMSSDLVVGFLVKVFEGVVGVFNEVVLLVLMECMGYSMV